MTFTNRVTTITQDFILPSIIDTVLSDNFVSFRLMSNAKKWRGHQMQFPIKYQKSTQGGSYSGTDTLNTGTTQDRVNLTFDLRAYNEPVVIPGLEKVVNRGESQVLNLVQTELESRQQDMTDSIGTIFYADGTGNSNKDFLGWDLLADDTTTSSTIGGLSKSTYTTLQGTRTASGGTMTLTKISTLMFAVSAGSASKQKPTVLVSDETVWGLYESLLQPTVRANYETNGYPRVTRRSRGAVQSNRGDYGFESVMYRGTPWVADEKSTSQTLWAWNENYVNFYGAQDADMKQISFGKANIDGPYSEAPTENVGFQWTGFMSPIDQHAEVAHIRAIGNLITNNPKRQGRLTGITGV